MFLFLSASRCKAQSRLFSESCSVPVVLEEPETRGRELQEPQFDRINPVYNSLYKQTHKSIPVNNPHCQHKQAGMPGVQHPAGWDTDLPSSVLSSAPLTP